MARVDDIRDDHLRSLVAEARAAYREGDATTSVHKSVEALLTLMEREPDLIQLERAPGTPARKGYVWPALGVKVEVGEGNSPRAVYDREQFSTAEAITFYEFAVDSAVAAGQ